MTRGTALLLAAVVALPVAATGVVLMSQGSRGAAEAEEFQRLVGGLGLGAAVDLSQCAAAFDPRDGNACSRRHEPVPLGSLFCPAHSGG
ncbi:MAG: hypothetical protein L6Q95_14805 [Planctomycetes bacterium]|nr:hypothetical protein [Planctomycetota bacterium]